MMHQGVVAKPSQDRSKIVVDNEQHNNLQSMSISLFLQAKLPGHISTWDVALKSLLSTSISESPFCEFSLQSCHPPPWFSPLCKAENQTILLRNLASPQQWLPRQFHEDMKLSTRLAKEVRMPENMQDHFGLMLFWDFLLVSCHQNGSSLTYQQICSLSVKLALCLSFFESLCYSESSLSVS